MASVDTQRTDGGVQVVARVADVLRCLEGESRGLSLAQIAERVGLARSTVHRLVVALEHEGFVVPASPNGRVRLGPALTRLAAASRPELRQDLEPTLRQLGDELEETVDLAVLDGQTVRFIEQIPAPHRLRAVSSVGDAFPLHCTANGKALLAALPREQAEELLPARFQAFTPNTITTRDVLWGELDEVNRVGYAVDREEHHAGICAVGAVVRDVHGPAAAITVVVPTTRFAGNEQHLAARLVAATAQASELLGG